MSLDEIKAKVPSKQRNRIDLVDLPPSIVAHVVDYEYRADSKGKECYFVNFIAEDGREFTQKYSPKHLEELVANLEHVGAGGLHDLSAGWWLFRQKAFRMGYPRMFPVEKVKKQEKLAKEKEKEKEKKGKE